MRTAWAENPSIAVHLASRFPYPRIHKEVRWLLLNFPAKAASEPEAIPILIDGALPEDVNFQLKVSQVKLGAHAILKSFFMFAKHGFSTCFSGRRSTPSPQ
jgi:hypothetical protein